MRAEVEKFAGKIRIQMAPIGISNDLKIVLKSESSSCLRARVLATKMIRDNFAKSEVWKVSGVPGISNQRLASPALTPFAKVKMRSGIERKKPTVAIREKIL
jgi:hypothetical protein